MKREYLGAELIPAWARSNGIVLNGIQLQSIADDDSRKGTGVVAKREGLQDADEPSVLMVIPQGLVLSLHLVESYARSDRHLREVLHAVGNFGRVCIMTYGTIQLQRQRVDICRQPEEQS